MWSRITQERDSELWQLYNDILEWSRKSGPFLSKAPFKAIADALFELLRNCESARWHIYERDAQLERIRQIFAIRPTEELTLAAAMYDSPTLPITGWRKHPFVSSQYEMAWTSAAPPPCQKCFICGEDRLRTWHSD